MATAAAIPVRAVAARGAAWGDRDNGSHAPAIDYRGTVPSCSANIDFDLPQGRRCLEVPRSACVIKRFMVRKMVGNIACRHDAVTGHRHRRIPQASRWPRRHSLYDGPIPVQEP